MGLVFIFLPPRCKETLHSRLLGSLVNPLTPSNGQTSYNLCKKFSNTPVFVHNVKSNRLKYKRQVAMVEKFPDDSKPNTSLIKMSLHCFNFVNLIHFISFHLLKCLRKFLGLNPKGPYLSWKKKKKIFVLYTPKSGLVKLGSFLSQSCNDG